MDSPTAKIGHDIKLHLSSLETIIQIKQELYLGMIMIELQDENDFVDFHLLNDNSQVLFSWLW